MRPAADRPHACPPRRLAPRLGHGSAAFLDSPFWRDGSASPGWRCCSSFAGLVALYAVARPVSTLMLGRLATGRSYERVYVRLADIAPIAVASVIASEDDGFCQNDGVDWDALHDVISRAGKRGPSRGASTITMQTAKNLFLWPGRSKIRKGIEIGAALVLGQVWSKARTIEVYLNIAEWGDGVYGIEAAAQRYFHKRASQLDAREAALAGDVAAQPDQAQRRPPEPDAAHPRRPHRRPGRRAATSSIAWGGRREAAQPSAFAPAASASSGGDPGERRHLVAGPGELAFGVVAGVGQRQGAGFGERQAAVEMGDQMRHAVGAHHRQRRVEFPRRERRDFVERAAGAAFRRNALRCAR